MNMASELSDGAKTEEFVAGVVSKRKHTLNTHIHSYIVTTNTIST